MTQKGTYYSLSVLAEDPVPADGDGGIGSLSVGVNNCTDGAESNDAPNLLLGRKSNLR